MKKLIKSLASLKLAVIVILLFAVISAVGTIVESKYDARAAQLLVYHSIYMYFIMALLTINLIAVMVDRWPWKERHIGFVCAHIGIIILLVGSIVTKIWGVDGSMSIGIGESNQYVTVPDTEVVVFSSFTGDSYTRIFSQPVNFFLEPAHQKPLHIPIMGGEIKIIDSMPYATASERINETADEKDGAAIRFQIKNANVNLNDWLLQRTPGALVAKSLGPAKIYFGDHADEPGENSVTVIPKGKDKNGEHQLAYKVSYRDGKKPLSGIVKVGEPIQTGWMGLEFKVLNFYPKAKREWNFRKMDRPSAMTTSAVKVRFQDQEQWVQLNDILRFFTQESAYVFRYSNQLVDLGESIKLKKFEVGRYQGSMMAMAYESTVEVPGLGERLISMNDPLKYKGYTLYQASFSEDESGKATTSVLSVNYDPGRWLKYLGSLVMCFGIVHLFWFKRRERKAKKGVIV